MSFPPFHRSTLAVFDLDHLDTLSSDPDQLLLLSEQTLYVILNLVNADVTDPYRYATELERERYVPVTPSDAEYVLFKEVRERVQLEVYPVSLDDTNDLLEDIKNQQLPADTESHTYQGTAIAVTENYVSDVVPANECWLVSAMLCLVTTGPCGSVRFQVYTDGNYVTVEEVKSPSVGTRYNHHGQHWLVPGDRIRIQFRNCTIGTTVVRAEWTAAQFNIQ